MPDNPSDIRRPWPQRIELIFVFLAGFALLSHIYAWDLTAPLTSIGAPGNDSFYHTRMAGLIPEHGLLHEFPWLRWTWFTQHDDRFVSHHYGFHMLLLPFTQAAQMLGYDELTGGRWFMCTMFGLQLALLDAILITAGVRFRLFWLALVLLWPHQFFERQAFVRAVGPATVGLLTLTWLLLNRRYVIMAVMIAAFLHLYLGAVLYVPVIIAAAAFAYTVTARRWRDLPWQLVLAGLLGWGLGIVSHPYQTGMYEFLQMQVFGTGLAPDIEVGREWRPYTDVWWFTTELAGPTLLALGAALVLRLYAGPRLNGSALTVLLVQGIFLVLMFKARRFVEFWPPFALLAAAYLAGPAIQRIVASVQRGPGWKRIGATALAWLGGLALAGLMLRKWGQVPTMPNATWLVICAGLLGAALVVSANEWRSRLAFAQAGVAALPLLCVAVGLAGPRLEEARANSRCRYDLAALREMMGYMQANTPRDAIVFTDDWDVFPAYFYHNTHNRFVVGLDPKFTHDRRPDLWDRYVKITRAQVPTTMKTQLVTATGHEDYEMRVQLADIRTHFQADYVIVDDDHDRLADLLDEAWTLAAPFWPTDPDEFRRGRYRVYRIRSVDEPVPPRPRNTVEADLVYLTDLPIRSRAGDHLFLDQLPDGESVTVGGRRHLRGLSVRGANELRVTSPEGDWHLRATVGLTEPVDGLCLLRVLQDGRIVHREELTTEARTIEVPLTNQAELVIETIGPREAVFVIGSPLLARIAGAAGT